MMKQLRAGAPLAVRGSVLIPIERVIVRVESDRHDHWLSVTKEVAAIVVCGPDGLRAIDVQAREMPVDELIREVPGLAAVVAVGTLDAWAH